MKNLTNLLLFFTILTISLSACGDKEKPTVEDKKPCIDCEPLATFHFKFINESGYEVRVTMGGEIPRPNLIPDELIVPRDGVYEWSHLVPDTPTPIYFQNNKTIMTTYFDEKYHTVFLNDHHKFCPAKATNFKYAGPVGEHDVLFAFTFTKEMVEYAKFLNEQGLEIAGSEEPGSWQ